MLLRGCLVADDQRLKLEVELREAIQEIERFREEFSEAMDSSTDDVKQFNEQLSQIDKELKSVEDLTKSVDKLKTSFQGNRGELEKSTRAILTAISAIEKQGNVTDETRRRISVAVKKLTKEWQVYGAEVPRALQKADEAYEKSGKGVEDLKRRFSSLEKTLKRLAGTFAAVFSARSLASFTQSSVQAQIALENMGAAMLAAVGDGEAQKNMEFLRREADRLGINFQFAAQSFTKFAAATKGTTLAGQQARDIFTSVAEAAAVMGLSASATRGVLEALEQIVSKNTVSAEEIRRQMQKIPGAFQLAAASIGKTTEELDSLLKTGKLTAEELLPAFAGAGGTLQKQFEEGLPKAINSTRAAMERLGNAWFDLKGAFGEGLSGELVKSTKELTEQTRRLSLAAKVLGERLGMVLEGVRMAADGYAQLGSLLGMAAVAVRGLDESQAKLTKGTKESAEATRERLRLAREQALADRDAAAAAAELAAAEKKAAEEREKALAKSIEEQVAKFTKALRGNREELEKTTSALLASIAAIEEQGNVTDETKARISEALKELTDEWLVYGKDVPEVLKKIARAYPQAFDELMEKADEVSEAVARAREEFEALEKVTKSQEDTVDDLTDKEAALAAEVEELNRLGLLSAEQSSRQIEADLELGRVRAELAKETRALRQSQQELEQAAANAAAPGQGLDRLWDLTSDLGDATLQTSENWSLWNDTVRDSTVWVEKGSGAMSYFNDELEESSVKFDSVTREMTNLTDAQIENIRQAEAQALAYSKLTLAAQDAIDAQKKLKESVEETTISMVKATEAAS